MAQRFMPDITQRRDTILSLGAAPRGIASMQTEATSRSLVKSVHNKQLGRWRMNEVNASVPLASIQTEATSRSLVKSMHNKKLVCWRVNEVNASVH
jgi:hypothetical protein